MKVRLDHHPNSRGKYKNHVPNHQPDHFWWHLGQILSISGNLAMVSGVGVSVSTQPSGPSGPSFTGTTSGDRSEMKKVRPCHRAPKALPGEFSIVSRAKKKGCSMFFPSKNMECLSAFSGKDVEFLEYIVSIFLTYAISIVSHEKMEMGGTIGYHAIFQRI